MDFETYSKSFLHFHTEEIPDLLLKHLNKDASFSLADFGAGDGALLVALKLGGYLKNVTHVTAVDLSPERCKRLREYTDFTVICSDVTLIPEIADSSVDFVICTQVIEHVDQTKLLAEIRRVLKPEGVIYIASLVKKWYGWWYYRTLDGKWAMDPTHLREYSSKEEYEKVITDAGFTIVQTRLSKLRLSVFEFLLRRVIVPIFNPNGINSFFIKHPCADFFRKKVNVYPPGYFIIETVAKLESI
jgi:ubiquinone/menaquinone biosynthesis C-methylase UbiE